MLWVDLPIDVERYGGLYYEMARQAQPRRWNADLVRRIESERRAILPRAQLGERSAWRDKRLMLLAAHKAAAARATGNEPAELT